MIPLYGCNSDSYFHTPKNCSKRKYDFPHVGIDVSYYYHNIKNGIA